MVMNNSSSSSSSSSSSDRRSSTNGAMASEARRAMLLQIPGVAAAALGASTAFIGIPRPPTEETALPATQDDGLLGNESSTALGSPGPEAGQRWIRMKSKRPQQTRTALETPPSRRQVVESPKPTTASLLQEHFPRAFDRSPNGAQWLSDSCHVGSDSDAMESRLPIFDFGKTISKPAASLFALDDRDPKHDRPVRDLKDFEHDAGLLEDGTTMALKTGDYYGEDEHDL